MFLFILLGTVVLFGLLLTVFFKLSNELRIYNKLVKEQTALFNSISKSIDEFSIGLPCRLPPVIQNKIPKFKKRKQHSFS